VDPLWDRLCSAKYILLALTYWNPTKIYSDLPHECLHNSIDHCSVLIRVLHQFLNGSDILPMRKQMGRERMAVKWQGREKSFRNSDNQKGSLAGVEKRREVSAGD